MGCVSANQAPVIIVPACGPADKSVGASVAQTPQQSVRGDGIGRSMFIVENPGQIRRFYDMEERLLGKGAFGSVCKAKHKAAGHVRAIKMVAKEGAKNLRLLRQEIAVMRMMDHPNIIKLHETFEDNRNLYLCMELCSGGELFDRILDSGRFSEAQAATLMQQIIRAVNYMHINHVCHRDLKPENFVFANKDDIDKSTLKLIDFGLAREFQPGKELTTKAGSPYYVAPQVLQGRYNHLSDLWSCGVILYILLCGYPPFVGETEAKVFAQVRMGNFRFKPEDWIGVSEDAKDLVRMLLKMNSCERYTAEQALSHVWITNKAPKVSNAPLQEDFIDRLRSFRWANKLKKVALNIIAGQLDEACINDLREMFLALDDNGDGKLTVNEIREGLGRLGLQEMPPDLQHILEAVDSDGSGIIDYSEFLAASLGKTLYMQEDRCQAAFDIFDRDRDGKITQGELEEVLEKVNSGTIAAMIRECDDNSDGVIDFHEFMAMMRRVEL